MYISVWDMNKFKNGLEDDDEQCCYLPRYGTDITGLGIYYYVILVDSESKVDSQTRSVPYLGR